LCQLVFFCCRVNLRVRGVPENAAQALVKNFVSMVSNLNNISPTVYLTPDIFDYEGKKVIHIHIPSSSEVHTYKKVVFDRVGDADVKVTATGQIAQMYIRKQKIFTEKKVYPYVRDEYLRLDMLPRIRQMALLRDDRHPWKKTGCTPRTPTAQRTENSLRPTISSQIRKTLLSPLSFVI